MNPDNLSNEQSFDNPDATSNNNGLEEIFQAFSQLRILVIGDAMVDHYVYGNTERISPEAPIPVVDVSRFEKRPGGAANVAMNILGLGGQAILASVIGDDDEGHNFKQRLQEKGLETSGVLLDLNRRTTLKTRVISRNQQILRYDYESPNYLDEKMELLFLDNIIDIIYNEKPNAVIFQDYNKGILTPNTIKNVIHNCRESGIPIAVDPKKDNFFTYQYCNIFKPNLEETMAALGKYIDTTNKADLMEADRILRSHLHNEFSVITLSEKGIFIGAEDDHDLIPAYPRNITDVSGAGDTVIAMLAMGLGLGLDTFAMAELANMAAGIVCEQSGVVPIDKNVLMKEAGIFYTQ